MELHQLLRRLGTEAVEVAPVVAIHLLESEARAPRRCLAIPERPLRAPTLSISIELFMVASMLAQLLKDNKC